MASAFGLSNEDALKAATLGPAQIIGVGDRLRSLEVGKIANLVKHSPLYDLFKGRVLEP